MSRKKLTDKKGNECIELEVEIVDEGIKKYLNKKGLNGVELKIVKIRNKEDNS